MPRCRLALSLLVLCLISATAWGSPDGLSAQIRARIEVLRTAQAEGTAAAESPRPAQVRDLTLAEAVGRFYDYRSYRPAWTDPEIVEALLRELAELWADGLDPEHYHLSTLRRRHTQLVAGGSAEDRAAFELMASEAYLRALAHLFRGKVQPATLEAQWNIPLQDMAATEAMALVSAAVDDADIAAIFARARPRHTLYLNLREALATLRRIEAAGGWPTITATTTLKPGMRDPQIVLLRRRLALAGYLPAQQSDGDLYDETLLAAVRQFQREQYLEVDGAVGPATRAALNVPVAARIDQLRVNLERGRWVLQGLPERAVVVDIAGYRAWYLRGGERVWEGNVQVGRPYRSTPVFRADITYVTFNPTWTVPPTIYRQDMLPKIRRDPGYLAKNHLRVLTPSGSEIDPSTVDWQRPGNIMLRADAGPGNPLGRVVIRFPNSHAIYMHDTPNPELFGRSQRAFSSGCIRVEGVWELVALLLDDPQRWSRDRIDAAVATGETRHADLARPVPVLLGYWTADVPASKHIVFKPDIYGKDGPLLAALHRPPPGYVGK
jgi:murein L,D-transpeptidase YcbB/YkuD